MTQQGTLFGHTMEVASHSTPGVVYTIDLKKKTCSCPAFLKGGGRACKHLKEHGVVVEPEVPETLKVYGKVNPGAMKSAIQKGFRRNDQQMLADAFDYFWVVNRKWLFWRWMVLPAEDAWGSVLNMGRAIHQAEALLKQKTAQAEEQAREVMRTTLLTEAATKKNRDGNGMRWLGKQVLTLRKESKHARAAEVMAALEKKMAAEDMATLRELMRFGEIVWERETVPPTVWAEIWGRVGEHENDDPERYKELRDAVGAVYFRSKKGGGSGYVMMFLSVALQVLQAYEQGKPLTAPPSDQSLLEDSFGQPRPKNSLPWYCVDMHTWVGKNVLKEMQRQHPEVSPLGVEEVWFLMETTLVNEVDPGSVWWEKNARVFLYLEGLGNGRGEKLWQEIGPKIRARLGG